MAESKKRVPIVKVGKPWADDDLDVSTSVPKVQVGRPWTEDDVRVAHLEASRRRTSVATWLSVAFVALTVAFSGYAMLVGDTTLVHDVFGYIGKGLLASAAWACGGPLLDTIKRRVSTRRASRGSRRR